MQFICRCVGLQCALSVRYIYCQVMKNEDLLCCPHLFLHTVNLTVKKAVEVTWMMGVHVQLFSCKMSAFSFDACGMP